MTGPGLPLTTGEGNTRLAAATPDTPPKPLGGALGQTPPETRGGAA